MWSTEEEMNLTYSINTIYVINTRVRINKLQVQVQLQR